MSLSVSGRVVNAGKLGALIRSYAAQVEQSVDEVTREQTSKLRDDIIQGWPVDTTASRAAWQGPIKIADGHYELRNEIPYTVVIEYGGYPGVGPKTARQSAQALPGGVEINGGIYPTQRPAAPVRQALSKRSLELTRQLEGRALKQLGFRGFAR